MARIIAKRIGVFLAAMILAIQFVPVERTNPPVTGEPKWDTAATRALAVRACFDCHSNETRWPWYSYVAPVSWLVARDVRKARGKLNFSEWPRGDLDEAVEEIEEGNMPLKEYLLLHPEARLSDSERKALIDGLSTMERNSY